MKVLETERLVLRWMSPERDAETILELLNDPAWIRFIGDRGVRTLEGARDYVSQGPVAMYEKHGYGLYMVELRSDGRAIGICGLLKRDTLPDVDIGFALLERFRSAGYAGEAAAGVMEYGQKTLGLRRVLAITSLDNDASIRLLGRLGFQFEETFQLPGDTETLRLFAWEAGAVVAAARAGAL